MPMNVSTLPPSFRIGKFVQVGYYCWCDTSNDTEDWRYAYDCCRYDFVAPHSGEARIVLKTLDIREGYVPAGYTLIGVDRAMREFAAGTYELDRPLAVESFGSYGGKWIYPLR